MNVSRWGNNAWTFLDATCFNAPEDIPISRRQIYKLFFVDNLKDLLPCVYCRDSFVQYSDELPIEAFWDTRAGLSVWLYKIHEKVNAKLSKPNISFFDYVKKVEAIRAKCSKSGAKGCTEPHIEKNNTMCKAWARSAWDRYGDIDFEKWRLTHRLVIIAKWMLSLAFLSIMIKLILRYLIKFRSSNFIKFIS